MNRTSGDLRAQQSDCSTPEKSDWAKQLREGIYPALWGWMPIYSGQMEPVKCQPSLAAYTLRQYHEFLADGELVPGFRIALATALATFAPTAFAQDDLSACVIPPPNPDDGELADITVAWDSEAETPTLVVSSSETQQRDINIEILVQAGSYMLTLTDQAFQINSAAPLRIAPDFADADWSGPVRDGVVQLRATLSTNDPISVEYRAVWVEGRIVQVADGSLVAWFEPTYDVTTMATTAVEDGVRYTVDSSPLTEAYVFTPDDELMDGAP